MVRLISISRQHVFAALAAALLLRAMIPAGFMPAAIGAGFPLQVCPSGLPGGALQRLAGAAGHDHHHHHHHNHEHHTGGDGAAYTAEQCPIGHLLAAAAIPVTLDFSVPRPAAPAIVGAAPSWQPVPHRVHWRPRAPPSPLTA